MPGRFVEIDVCYKIFTQVINQFSTFMRLRISDASKDGGQSELGINTALAF